MAKLANTATTSTPQSQSSPAIHNHSLQTHNHDSIDNLRKLSAFKCCFTEQHQYIDSVRSTIHSALPPLTTNTPLLPASWESDPSEEEEEADKAALAWTSRLIVEGGVRKASKMDARGLLLLIGCFGILGGFRNEDIRDLLQSPQVNHAFCYVVQNEAKVKHLFALKSVIKCLKRHDVDPSKLLPGCKIDEKIMTLEKEIAGFDEQIGSMDENVAGSLAGTVGGVAMGGAGSGISTSLDVVQQRGSYVGGHGGTLHQSK
ncbi:hypothetical protein K7X08_024216 [Anisodus acutangulus]|uniref:FRIGIDA-like protein n=1 Tax=Anisodus acutangulus TaxID=402998 RepID=A0A9Q1RFS2_9SOLA|nr:hypothetical protein K7X08_024216 [Anisodus acutangulus]